MLSLSQMSAHSLALKRLAFDAISSLVSYFLWGGEFDV